MKTTLLNLLQFISMLLLMQACTDGPGQRNYPPPPAPPTCFLPLFGHLYGKPKEIRETIIEEGSKPSETSSTLDWASRKAIGISPQAVTYLDADFRPDSTVSPDHKEFQHYFKTPYYQYYFSFTHTNEPQEYHFPYELDTVNRTVRELKYSAPADTSEYSIDYFSPDGFLVHRFVKLGKKDFYHLYYTNDNHGNPIEARMVMSGADFVQEKYYYDYDEQGNWLTKELYHYNLTGERYKMKFTRKIAY
jgi:hypothetical protein